MYHVFCEITLILHVLQLINTSWNVPLPERSHDDTSKIYLNDLFDSGGS